MSENWERDLGRLIWDVKTSDDATAIIDECIKRFRAKPIAIGRENNSGTIDVAARIADGSLAGTKLTDDVSIETEGEYKITVLENLK